MDGQHCRLRRKIGVRSHLKQWSSAPIFPITGSMALLANGFQMATHAAALGIAASDYSYAKRNAVSIQYGFDSGKAGDLGGFASALIFGLLAISIGIESVVHFAQEIREIIEQSGDTKIIDLRVWQLGPEARVAIVSVVGNASVTADVIRERLVALHEVTNLTLELRSV